jgi:xanthine dehydrogenase accessory factor
VLRAPAGGHVHARAAIGDVVQEGHVIAHIDGAPIVAPFDGVLRGIIHPSVAVHTGMKIGDLDARAERRYCFTISDKSLAIAGGVLEAILAARAEFGSRRLPGHRELIAINRARGSTGDFRILWLTMFALLA